MNEYDEWYAAWKDTIAADPARPCLCGGTFSSHRMTCPLSPPYGYDGNGLPITESQLPKVMQELGRKAAARVNALVMQELFG